MLLKLTVKKVFDFDLPLEKDKDKTNCTEVYINVWHRQKNQENKKQEICKKKSYLNF